MTDKELQRQARAMSASVLAHAAGVDETALRRWLAGGVNVEVAAAVRNVLENKQ